MSKLLKSLIAGEYRQALGAATSCVLMDVSPLKVGEVEDFRRHLRENDVRLRVIKNNLAYHAVEGSPLETVRSMFVGPTAIAFDEGDTEGVATVKAIKRYLDENKKLKAAIKGGLSEGEALDAAAITELANIPDRPQLQAILLGAILGPARGIAAAMAAVPGGLTRVLQAKVEKEGGGEDGSGDS